MTKDLSWGLRKWGRGGGGRGGGGRRLGEGEEGVGGRGGGGRGGGGRGGGGRRLGEGEEGEGEEGVGEEGEGGWGRGGGGRGGGGKGRRGKGVGGKGRRGLGEWREGVKPCTWAAKCFLCRRTLGSMLMLMASAYWGLPSGQCVRHTGWSAPSSCQQSKPASMAELSTASTFIAGGRSLAHWRLKSTWKEPVAIY